MELEKITRTSAGEITMIETREITGISVEESTHRDKLPETEKASLSTFAIQQIKELPHSKNEILTPFCSRSEEYQFGIRVVEGVDYCHNEVIENKRAGIVRYNGTTIKLW